MNILITGASGLVGTALNKYLSQQGHTIYTLERSSSNSPFHWQPHLGQIYLENSITLDAVVHLAGANIAEGRWTQGRKKIILESREQATQLLAQALADLPNKPKVFLSGSAMGIYAEQNGAPLTEESPYGENFLSQVCQKWEKATQTAQDAGIRTVHLRTSMVLTRQGGALAKMLPPFQMGVGGILGDGNQIMSWVSIAEMLRMIEFLLETSSVEGPVNIASPYAVSNFEFTKTLGKVLGRPTILPLPAFAIKLLMGQMGEELLLSSLNVVPKKLQSAGFDFSKNELTETLKDLLETR